MSNINAILNPAPLHSAQKWMDLRKSYALHTTGYSVYHTVMKNSDQPTLKSYRPIRINSTDVQCCIEPHPCILLNYI